MNNPTSSSSSSFIYGWTYDVFISFRGPDTRKRFIGYLYQKLCEIKEVKTFMDDRTIEPGEQIDETLIKAIQESRIALVVFSQNYASSSFCLEELAMIIECSIDQKRMLFLPVFYEVEPSILRHQIGSYKEALAKHEARFEKKKTQMWRMALNKAAGVSGFSSDNYKYDSDLIGDIAQSITKKISNLREGDKNQAQQPKPQTITQLERVPWRQRVDYNKQPKPESSSFTYRGVEVEHLPEKRVQYNKIPGEEENPGTDGKLIHVYHFKTYTAPNGEKQIQNFGDPFCMVIHKHEKLIHIKARIQKMLGIPYDEFSKWKFASVRYNHAEDLKKLKGRDSVSDQFESGSTYGDWEQYLGLEHADK